MAPFCVHVPSQQLPAKLVHLYSASSNHVSISSMILCLALRACSQRASPAKLMRFKRVQPGSKPAVLAVQAYDVEKNQDIFFKEVQDGVNAIAVGKMGPAGATLVIVGGERASCRHTGLPWLELRCWARQAPSQ